MIGEVPRLVEDVIRATGADSPDILADDSPALGAQRGDGGDFYLVGLIGGKDVGKSSFVNALVGEQITAASSFGEGTQSVVAYAHRDAVPALRHLLSRQVPGRFEIHPHQVNSLRRQVLLDLPDIDSIYDSHIQTTRSMLRHMLYPIWIQSIEKYADLLPQKLLARVAEGNDPANFIFCLNKVDQLVKREGDTAAAELRDDYARRLARLLKLPAPPQVNLISATHPAAFDLPALRSLLAKEKNVHAVQLDQARAEQQQARTLLAWLDAQQLSARTQRADHLLSDASDLLTARLVGPLLEDAVPALTEDAGRRIAMTDPVMSARMARWPIVNVVHAAVLPLTALLRRNLGAAGDAVNVDAHLPLQSQTLAGLVQTTFAQLQQSNPSAGALYRDRKLWEEMSATLAADELRQRYSATFSRQRAALVQRIAGRSGLIAPIFRFLLTIGAALWFPIIQPLLAIVAARDWVWRGLDVARLAIQLLSAMYLLQSIGFLLLYFIVLYAILRWHTQRRVNQLLHRWQRPDAEPALSLGAQSIEWMDDLLAPMRDHRDQLLSLSERIEALRGQLVAQRDAA
jgi:GTPase Era involved in 16S rRNA processing